VVFPADVRAPPTSYKLIYSRATHFNSISTTGASEYKLNNKTVTYNAYSLALTSHNILIKARNFLVFQGDVEAVASQSPQALSKLVDQISGSLELKTEYEKCKEEMEKATERATENFGKRRGIAGEIKTYKEQKGEAEKFEGLVQERVSSIYSLLLGDTRHNSIFHPAGRTDPSPYPIQALPH